MANNFLPFCETDTGTNLLTQGEYAASADRTSGNKPGVASSKLVNKAIRQSSLMVSQLAQLVADRTNTDLLDDANTEKLLGQLTAALTPIAPIITRLTSGSGTYSIVYFFFIATGDATAGATYTNNSHTFTVVETVTAGSLIKMTGTGAPSNSGTLVKASGTGDSTLTFFAKRAPISLDVVMCGGGAGGNGSGTGSRGLGTNGSSTTFGSSLLTTTGGEAGLDASGHGGSGGTFTVNSPAVNIFSQSGGRGGGGSVSGVASTQTASGAGGTNPLCGGAPSVWGNFGLPALANTGGGGGGAGQGGTSSNDFTGAGGGAGAYIKAAIPSPSSTYAYTVGVGGSAGAAGSNGRAGGAGAAGVIVVTAFYQ